MSYLEMENTAPVFEKIHKSFIDNHLSFIYERVCRELVKEMASEGFFGDKTVRIGRWWDSKEEIDIVGVNGDNKPVIFGECKYREGPVGIETLRELQGKALMVSKAAGSAFLLFSRKGFSKELLDYSRRNDNVFLFELFQKIR